MTRTASFFVTSLLWVGTVSLLAVLGHEVFQAGWSQLAVVLLAVLVLNSIAMPFISRARLRGWFSRQSIAGAQLDCTVSATGLDVCKNGVPLKAISWSGIEYVVSTRRGLLLCPVQADHFWWLPRSAFRSRLEASAAEAHARDGGVRVLRRWPVFGGNQATE